MITGDNAPTAPSQEVGIDRVMATCCPPTKLLRSSSCRRRDASRGDGRRRHQTRPLAQADVGIAIGTGTDVAMEAADVTLMSGDLRGVPRAIRLSRNTMRTIKENLVWAFGYNVALIPIAMGILATASWAPDFLRQLNPMLAAFAMAFTVGIMIWVMIF
jgi:Cu+-exporting ATPase